MSMSRLTGPRLEPASGGTARQLVVILHGYGADGADLIDLGGIWSRLLPDAAFVAPDAPELLPYEGFDGRQWFALSERDMREYSLGVESASPVLNHFLDHELDRLGLDGTRLAIAGFSQGAMMALHTGLHRSPSPAAILAFSGLLADPDGLEGISTRPPVLIVHGADDDVVPAYHLPIARDALLKAGLRVEDHCLDALGHGIDDRAMALGGEFLARAFT